LSFVNSPQKSADAGRYSVTVEVPKNFNPQSVKFFWRAKNFHLARPDGSKIFSILDDVDLYNDLEEQQLADGLNGLLEYGVVDQGRKATFQFFSIIGAQVSVILEAKENDGGNGLSVSVPLQFTFLPNSSSANLVAKLPAPDKISLDINNPDPGSAASTTVSVKVSDVSPRTMAIDDTSYKYQRSYWIMRINKSGLPISPLTKITPSDGSPIWAKFKVTQDSYRTAGLNFRVIFGQVFPELDHVKSSELFSTVCPSCMGPIWSYFYNDFSYTIAFKNTALEKIGFQWSTDNFSDLTATWKNPTGTIINDNGTGGYKSFYFRFQRDISKLPTQAVCEKTVVDLQYKKGSSWISAWTDESFGYSGAPSTARDAGGYPYLNCLDYTKNENGLTLESNISQEYMNIDDIMPYPSPELPVGTYSFRFVLKSDYLDSSGNAIGSRIEEPVTPFNVKYIDTPAAPTLRVSVNYPSQTLLGRKYLASVSTSPKASGSCSYYLFNRVRIPVGSSALRNGKSSLSVSALSLNVGNGLPSSLTVVCTSQKMTGSGGTLFYIVGRG